MAQQNINEQAETGTEQEQNNQGCTPKWDEYSREMYPFLSIKEDQKRAGFIVTFLSDKPRKETQNNFDHTATDFWFDVIYNEKKYTWTISQKSIVMELQKHKPLKDKTFDIKLIPVDEEFKQQYPKYKGNDRYDLKQIEESTAVKPEITNKGFSNIEEETINDEA
jgi:hypothetical protein